MPGVENHEMVQAISPNRADQALDVRILPRALRRCEDFLHVQRRNPQSNLVAVDSIPIANDIRRRIPLGKSLDDLLGGPGCRGMLSDIEMQHLATTMFQYDKHEQYLHRERRHSKEVDRYHLTDMIVQESLPGLVRRSAELSQNAGDGALGGGDAEHLQLAMN